MIMKNTSVYVDIETLEEFKIIAKRNGITFSRWVDSQMTKWIEEQNRLERVGKRSQED